MTDHPFFFTWTVQHGARPLEITGGDGAWFTTPDGRWLDLGALSYQVNAGHGRTRIVEAIKRQADELCLSAPNAVFPAKTELARRLLAMAGPGFARGKVFFTLGGAEANENAMKMARLVTGRLKMVSRYRSYHGASMFGALTPDKPATGGGRRSSPASPASSTSRTATAIAARSGRSSTRASASARPTSARRCSSKGHARSRP